MKNSLPLLQHPTLTVVIDDNRSYLATMMFRIDTNQPRKSFTRSEDAIAWLHSHPASPAPMVEDDESCEDMRQISSRALDPARFSEPTIVVVDYSMPGMNGLMLCEAIQDLPCKKILFTGEADDKIAIDAFNRKLIDRFINKGDPGAHERLRLEIAQLQREYFIAWGAQILAKLPQEHYGFLVDDPMVSLIQGYATTTGQVEHYLHTAPSGIVFIDASGGRRLMAIQSEEGMESLCEVAQAYDAPPALVDALRARQVVPYFDSEDGMYESRHAATWDQYCLPAKRVDTDRDVYYWAVFDLPRHPNITPYSEFKAVHGA